MALRLNHGGIMANYQCNAACRHCLYACSPKRSGGYISESVAKEVCVLLRENGCRSVHIGGGEPFLDFDMLVTLIQTITQAGITVEYVETNAFWADNAYRIKSCLSELHLAGADTLCISLDPFHLEYVPLKHPLLLAELCLHENFGYFLWQEKFLPRLSRANTGETLNRQQLEQLISLNYIQETARSYGLHMGGRAINIEMEYSAIKPIEALTDSRPCQNLLSSNHFHIDLYGRFIPPRCTGIALPLDEVIHGIPSGKYPVLEALLSGGVAGLLAYAREIGFVEKEQGYTSKCALCFHIRHWLSEQIQCPGLDKEHYTESLRYYD